MTTCENCRFFDVWTDPMLWRGTKYDGDCKYNPRRPEFYTEYPKVKKEYSCSFFIGRMEMDFSGGLGI